MFVYFSLTFPLMKNVFIISLSFLSFLLRLSLLFCCFTIQSPLLRCFFLLPLFLIHMCLFCGTLLGIYFPPSKIPSSPLPIYSSSFLLTYFLPRYKVTHSIYFSFSTAPIWGRWLTRCISYFGTLIPTSQNVTCNELSLKIVVKEPSFKSSIFSSTLNFLRVWRNDIYIYDFKYICWK